MRLSNEYLELYLQMLEGLTQASADRPWKRQTLSTHWPCLGETYDEYRELLVIGRALNGWDAKFLLKELSTADGRHRVIEASKQESASLSWIADGAQQPGGYNPHNSPFWMTLRDVLAGIPNSSRSDDWSQSIAWTNLYKVAPADGGNPSTTLCNVQLDGCRTLLAREIKELTPRRVLLVTDWHWAEDLVSGLHIQWRDATPADGHLEKIGRGLDATWVVARRPEGRPRAEVASQVCQAFARGDQPSR